MKITTAKFHLVLSFLFLAGISARAEVQIDKVLEIESVWAGHPVGFCLLTDDGYQYVAYYNTSLHVCVARRQLPDGDWEKLELTDYTFAGGNDAHNIISMGS